MPSSDRLCSLRERIANCTARAARPAPRVPTRWPAIDAALGGGIPAAGLHEWWGDVEDARAVCVHLAWRALLEDADRHPGAGRHVAWVGRAAWPATEELVRGLRGSVRGMFGTEAERTWPDATLHERSLLVDAPARDAGARLWAVEQAARCPGICAVVADGREFDLAATRRLQLAASDVLLLSLRGPACTRSGWRIAASAGSTRWHVERRPLGGAGGGPDPARGPWLRAPHPWAARLPPEPAWAVVLERAKVPDAHVPAACETVAFRSFEWDGTDRMPDRAAARVARRARRIDAIMVGPGMGAGAKRRGILHPDIHGADEDAPASIRIAPGGRRRGLGRMTSRGEGWARQVENGTKPVHGSIDRPPEEADGRHAAGRTG